MKKNKQHLATRGERTDNLIINLFKSYAVVKDEDFVVYISKKKNEYDKGSNLTIDQLMILVLNKYTNRKRTGEWNASTDKE